MVKIGDKIQDQRSSNVRTITKFLTATKARTVDLNEAVYVVAKNEINEVRIQLKFIFTDGHVRRTVGWSLVQ